MYRALTNCVDCMLEGLRRPWEGDRGGGPRPAVQQLYRAVGGTCRGASEVLHRERDRSPHTPLPGV